MKKTICLCIAGLFLISFHGATQCGSGKSSVTKKCSSQKSTAFKLHHVAQNAKTSLKSTWMPYVESSFQLGLCSESNPVAFMGGIEKKVSKHLSVAADVQYWKTDYEYWCDLYSKGTYSHILPSLKIKLDPGKQYKGFFMGAGLGYVFARDRGTDQPYTTEANGVNSPKGNITSGNWDYNSIAPSFSLGFSFKMHHYPVTVINTNYFAKSTDGWQDIATGVGLRFGLNKVREKKQCGAANKIRVVEKTRSCIYRCNKGN